MTIVDVLWGVAIPLLVVGSIVLSQRMERSWQQKELVANKFLKGKGAGHCTDCGPDCCPCWDQEQERRRAQCP